MFNSGPTKPKLPIVAICAPASPGAEGLGFAAARAPLPLLMAGQPAAPLGSCAGTGSSPWHTAGPVHGHGVCECMAPVMAQATAALY